MERKFQFSLGEYYHIYSRGVAKSTLFYNEKDYRRFMSLLYLANAEKSFHISNLQNLAYQDLFGIERGKILTNVGCYCLMPNHFHLLLRETGEEGISRFMGKLLTGYSMYFNVNRKRSGPLFVKPFRARHVNSDLYLKYLFAYIHLNPLSIKFPKWQNEIRDMDLEKAENFLKSYKHSSYFDFLDLKRVEGSILDRQVFPGYFQKPKDFSDFVREWVEIKRSYQGEPSLITR